MGYTIEVCKGTTHLPSQGEYNNLKAAYLAADRLISEDDEMQRQGFTYVGVEPDIHSNRFAVLYVTIDYIKYILRSNPFKDPAFKKAFLDACKKYLKTKEMVISEFPKDDDFSA